MPGTQLCIEDTVPNFVQQSSQGELNFYDYLGDHWGILFAHPADFTPVCTAEFVELTKLQEEFEKKNTKLVGLSIGNVDDHIRWLQEIEKIFGCKVNFPVIADEDRKVAQLYGMIHPQASCTTTVRPLLIISPDKKLKAWLNYPIFCGRNFYEVLRTLDALQLSEKTGVYTPPHWQPGEDVIIPDTITDDEAKKKYPEGWKTITPYYRVIPQPK